MMQYLCLFTVDVTDFSFPTGFDVLLEEVEDLKLDTPDAAEVTRSAHVPTPCPLYNTIFVGTGKLHCSCCCR